MQSHTVRLFVIILCNFPFFYVSSQSRQLFGTVKDERFIPIKGSLISVDSSRLVASDENGHFLIENYRGDVPDKIRVNKPGLEIASFSYFQDSLEIIMRKATYQILRGHASFLGGRIAPQVTVAYIGATGESRETVTDEKGNFRFILPPDLLDHRQQKARFTIDDLEVRTQDVALNDYKDFVVIKAKYQAGYFRPGKFFYVQLFDIEKKPLIGQIMWINGTEYKTKAQGRFTVRNTLVSQANQGFAIEGYDIVLIDSIDVINTIYVYVHKKRPNPPQLAVDTVQPFLEELLNEESTRTITASANVEANLDQILANAQSEQKILSNRAARLQKSIENFSLRLQNQNIDEQERIRLREYLVQLEESLKRNQALYDTTQQNTQKILKGLGESLLDEQEKANILAEQSKQQSAEFQRKTLLAVAIVLILVVLLVVAILFGRRIRKQKSELQATKNQLEDTFQVIKSQNLKITDSIRYAKTIQEAILPTQRILYENFKDFFVIYKPKDIVSGDFYWYNAVKTRDDRTLEYMAVIDCTGHGVPGGFMSMIGNAILRDIIISKGIYDTHIILELLNQEVIATLRQEDQVNEEGMDLCICRIEKATNNRAVQLQFTGAKRNLFVVREGLPNQVEIVRGNRRSIGLVTKKRKTTKFTKTNLSMHTNDIIYLVTDGLSDQMSPQKKKFGTNNLLELLRINAAKPLTEQKKIIEQNLAAHQQDEEQRDDITLIGIRF